MRSIAWRRFDPVQLRRASAVPSPGKRLKGKELSTREREKLHEEANELILKLRRELID